MKSESEVTQSCPTLCNPLDSSLPGSTVHGIFQARILEWAAISFSRGSSQTRDQTCISCIADRCFTIWAIREAPTTVSPQVNKREGTQLHLSTENWIKNVLSMAPPIRTRPSFPLSQSFPSGSFHKPLILICQRTNRMKTIITEN